ncbi:hypothetical protein NL676_013047 [Syzygium grande]|nr:hypothetical protein NL676_013047 [Syzygium grande]
MYGIINASIITRTVVDESGSLQQSTWHDRDQRWKEFWFAPKDQCDYYGKCGPNSNCNPYNESQFECTCLPGLEPKFPGDWYLRDGSAGCVRRGGVSVCRSGEGFAKVAHVKENKIPQPKGEGCDNSGFNFDSSTARRLLPVPIGDQEEKGCVT